MIYHAYKNMSPASLEVFGALVISRLSNNPILSSIKAGALLDLEPAQNAYSSATVAAKSTGGSDRYQLRDSCQAKLVEQLYYTSIIVEGFAKGDPDIIAAAGYELRKKRAKNAKKEPIAVITPTDFTVENIKNKPGFLHLAWSSVVGARNYAIELRIKGETVWKNGNYTTNEFIDLSGFASDSIVEFRIRALGVGEDKSDWTAIVKVLVD